MMSNLVAELTGSVTEFECCFFVCWFDKNRWPNGTIWWLNSPAENITETYFRV